jgi:hypothetical protein
MRLQRESGKLWIMKRLYENDPIWVMSNATFLTFLSPWHMHFCGLGQNSLWCIQCLRPHVLVIVHMRMSIKQTTSEHILILVYVTPCGHIPLHLCIVLFLISLRLSWLLHGWSRNVALLPVVPAFWQKTTSSREDQDNSRTFPINRRPATLTA